MTCAINPLCSLSLFLWAVLGLHFHRRKLRDFSDGNAVSLVTSFGPLIFYTGFFCMGAQLQVLFVTCVVMSGTYNGKSKT